MKKVLILIESLSGGGAEKVLSTLLPQIDKTKFEIHVCCICNIGKYIGIVKQHAKYSFILDNPDSLNRINLLFYKIKYKLIYNILPPRITYQLFIPKQYDVEVAFVEGFATKLLSRSINRISKKIAWVHCDFMSNHWTKSIFKDNQSEEKCYQSFDQVITVSKSAQNTFKSVFTKINTPIKTIYNPIDCTNIKQLSTETISDVPPKISNNRLISIGRLTKAKGFDRLIRIADRLASEGIMFELWILGEGELYHELLTMIIESKIEKYVKLLGFKRNPYCYLAQSDIFVCSSLSEGYSTAATEALTLGLPIITTNCSGMEELLCNGEYGIITENNEEALYTGLKALISDKKLQKHLSEKAIIRSKEFSLSRQIAEIENIFS